MHKYMDLQSAGGPNLQTEADVRKETWKPSSHRKAEQLLQGFVKMHFTMLQSAMKCRGCDFFEDGWFVCLYQRISTVPSVLDDPYHFLRLASKTQACCAEFGKKLLTPRRRIHAIDLLAEQQLLGNVLRCLTSTAQHNTAQHKTNKQGKTRQSDASWAELSRNASKQTNSLENLDTQTQKGLRCQCNEATWVCSLWSTQVLK